MHRLLALTIIPALMATVGLPSLLHMHAYGEHDHVEHHHGLAAHEHEATPHHSDEGLARLAGCDPGRHTVSYVFVCAAPPHVHAGDAELTLPATRNPEIQIERSVRHGDIRVHGPPPRTRSSPRAPPLIAHA